MGRLCVALLFAALLLPRPAEAFEIWQSDDGMRLIEFTPSLKFFFFGAGGFLEAPEGYEEIWPMPEVGGGSLMRLRLRFSADITSRIRFVVHYEHRPRIMSDGRLMSAASTTLQGDETVPLRLYPMVWDITRSQPQTSEMDAFVGPADSTFLWEHEIDWLFFSFAIPGGIDLVVGRQAIGWGVGRLWSPLDVFAPLTATDIDREERRGIDALKLTLRLGPASMFEVVLAGGTEIVGEGDDAEEQITWEASSLAWLIRTNRWGIDWMAMAGKVGRDRVFGGAVMGQIGGVALRGSATGTIDETNETHEPFLRATVGVEFGTSFNLTGIIEYHYNGFGTLDVADYLTVAGEQASRLSRGQIAGLGRHYAGVTLAWQPIPDLSVALVYIQNLQDGSLSLSPAINYAISDEVRLSFAAMIPLGRGAGWDTSGLFPEPEPRSELGMSPQLYLIQLRASI
jgi:hypothetical protein